MTAQDWLQRADKVIADGGVVFTGRYCCEGYVPLRREHRPCHLHPPEHFSDYSHDVDRALGLLPVAHFFDLTADDRFSEITPEEGVHA